jgi:hypothetical protein
MYSINCGSMFLKYLAKIDLILSKFSGQVGSEAVTFCVPFDNLTVLTDLAVLMENAHNHIDLHKL